MGWGFGLGLLHTDGEALSFALVFWTSWWTFLEHPFLFWPQGYCSAWYTSRPLLTLTALPETFATRAGWLCSGKFHGVCFSLVIRLWEETHWLEFPAKRLGRDSLGVTLGRWHCPRALGCSGRAQSGRRLACRSLWGRSHVPSQCAWPSIWMSRGRGGLGSHGALSGYTVRWLLQGHRPRNDGTRKGMGGP